jgi:glycosyltransferase involved in cell wall biosynthesis
MSSRLRILMIYDKRTTFVRRDIDILSEDHVVDEHHFQNSPKWKASLSLIHLFLKLLFTGRKYDVVVCQSAGYLSYAPAILKNMSGFKAVIIAIGTDAARLPEIGYGHYTKSLLSWFTTKSYRKSDLILPVHKSLEKDTYRYADIQFPEQGFSNLAGRVNTPVVEVVNGYDYRTFDQTSTTMERSVSFLTVAVKVGSASYYRKGFDLIMELARRMPEAQFTIVSEFPELEPIPENVMVMKNIDQKALAEVYNSHRFYLQLSMFEGFPNALCEAMLCGCIPIGSDVAGIPDIIGSDGYLLRRKDAEMLHQLALRAIEESAQSSMDPRKRIVENFPIDRRARELKEQIQSLN